MPLSFLNSLPIAPLPFFTQDSFTHETSEELIDVAHSLKLGGIIVITGGSGDKYTKIYNTIEESLREANLRKVIQIPDTMICEYGDDCTLRIKQLYINIWTYLKEKGVDLTNMQNKLPSTIWDPEVKLIGPKRVGLKIFRKEMHFINH